MIIFLLTTDGGDREDGNVYYARHLLVDAPEEAREAVRADIRRLLGANENLVFTAGNDRTDTLFNDADPATDLAAVLRELDWYAQFVEVDFIVQEEA